MSKQGEFIKNARRKRGLTQKQLAEKLNVSNKVISKWEVGDSFPDYTLLPQIADILQVDIQEILNGEYIEKPKTVAETKEVVYVEKRETESPKTFKEKVVNILLFIKKYQNYFFLGFYLLSFILLFTSVIKWALPAWGFSDNFFKFLFVLFQKDKTKYLCGDYISAMYTLANKNINVIACIMSIIAWIYVISLVILIVKVIISIVKKEKYDNNQAFKHSIIISAMCIVSFIVAKIIVSQINGTLTDSGMDMSVYKNNGMPIKTTLFWSILWSFVAVTFSSLFKYLKCLNTTMPKETDNQSLNNEIKLEKNLSENKLEDTQYERKSEKSSFNIDEKTKDKIKSITKICVVALLFLGVLIGGGFGIFAIVKKSTPSPQNTWNDFVNCINDSRYNDTMEYIYYLSDDQKDNYESYSTSYAIYSNLSTSSFRQIEANGKYAICEIVLNGTMIVSGVQTNPVYKYNVYFVKDTEDKWKILSPINITLGNNNSYQVDKTNNLIYSNIYSGKKAIFYYGDNFDSMKLPNDIVSISGTFYAHLTSLNANNVCNCPTNLISLTIPNTIKTIGNKAFTNYTSIIELYLPKNLRSIGDYAFYNSNNLVNLYYDGTGLTLGNKSLPDSLTFSISYDLGGGVNNTDNPYTYTANTPTFMLKTPTRSGYTFVGWTSKTQTTPTKQYSIKVGSIGNKTVKANWQTAIYSIKYNLNGGVNASTNPSSFSIESSSITLAEPTKKGYTFAGWTYEGVTTPRKNVTINTIGDKEFTANWNAITYTISYDLAGGINNSNNPSKYTADKDITLQEPTKTGYTFTGWTYDNITQPTKYFNTYNKFSNLTLKANWKLTEYTITYYLNGGSNSYYNKTTYTMETTTFSLYQPTKTGYTFAGWTGSNGSTKQTSVSISKGSTGNKSFTANWTPINYSIKYNLNGGTNNASNPSSYTIESGNIILQEPTRNGYTFTGWTGSNGTTPQKNITITKGSCSNMSFTANWTLVDYTISYDLNGGKLNGTYKTKYTIEDSSFTLIEPTKEYYVFIGWTGSNGSSPQKDITISKGSLGNKSYIANWTPYEYTITYNLNGGTNNVNNPTSYNIEDENFTLSNPTKDGHTFIGWTGSNGDEKQFNILVQSSWLKNLSYTANWRVNQYTVSYNSNGGIVEISSQNITYDENIEHPIPTRIGYIFDGWYYNEILYTNGVWKTSSNITLIAKWTPEIYQIVYKDITPSVTITLNYNYSGLENKIIYLEKDETFEYPTIPTRDGYMFTGWYLDSSCTNLFNFNEEISQSIILYAGWGNYTIVNNSTYPWLNSNGILTSTNKKDGSSSTYKIIAPGPITISFGYKTSSESNYDFLYIKKNDTQLVKVSGTQSNYTQYSVDLNKGDYLTFTYSKDSSQSSGNDCVYISDLSITPRIILSTAKALNDSNIYSVGSEYTQNIDYDSQYTLCIPIRDGYTFTGWHLGETLFNNGIWTRLSNIELTPSWQVNDYEVSFDANNGIVDINKKTITFDTEYTLPIPTRVGYQFDGWYYNDTLYTDGIWKTPNNITLVAKWIANTDTPYTINHYQQNLENDEYVLFETENLTGTSDSTITPNVKTYNGFNSPKTQTTTISSDGTRVINYYYTRVTYTLTIIKNDGNTEVKDVKYQANLASVINIYRDGFTLGGYFTDETLSKQITIMPGNNITVYVWWQEETKPMYLTYSGSSSITISGYTGTDTRLQIPTYIGNKVVTTISSSSITNKETLTEIVVPDSVTSIGEGVFKGCNKLTSITLPFVGSSKEVSMYAYDSSYYKYRFGYIFGYTTDAVYTSSSATYPSNTTTLTYQGESYYNRVGSSGSYKYYYPMYYIPQTLRNVTITKATGISADAFYGCSYLTSITLNKEVTVINSSAFYNCSGLTSFTVPENTTTIGGYAFYGCSSMSTLAFNEKVTTIGNYAFYGCVKVTEIDLPETLTTIGNYAFYNTRLKTLTIPSKVNSIGEHAFEKNVALTELVIPGNVKTIGSYAFSDCTQVSKLTLTNGITTIENYAFLNLVVTEIIVPDSVTSIGEGVFKGCNKLTSITLPFVGSSKEVSMYAYDSSYYKYRFGYIFGYTTDAVYTSSSATYPSNTTTLTYQGESYYNRVGSSGSYKYYYPMYYIPQTLRNVTITKATGISADAFYGCSYLTSITLNKEVTVINSSAFYNCFGLTSFIVPENTTSIESNAFYGCSSMESILLPYGLKTVGANVFSNCSKLNINCQIDEQPSGWNTNWNPSNCPVTWNFGCTKGVTEDGFDWISLDGETVKIRGYSGNATELTIPNSIEGKPVTRIDANTFRDNSKITLIKIPNSVNFIETNAFYNLSNLLTVIIPNSVLTIQSNSFSNCLKASFLCENNSRFIGWQSNWCSSTNAIAWDYANGNGVTEDGFKWALRSDDTIIIYGYNGTSDIITIPQTINEKTVCAISMNAFRNNKTLTAVHISNSITFIGDYAFSGCSNSIIYCQPDSRPSGWSSSWIDSSMTVYWSM